MSIVSKARDYGTEKHKDQKYGIHPYTHHLKSVVAVAEKHNLCEKVIAGCWLHDTIEDCGVTKDEIENLFGINIADIVFAVSDEPGENREARKAKTYPKIAANEKALQVKLCDRIANFQQSLDDENNHFIGMYKKEYVGFREKLYSREQGGETLVLWDILDELNK